MPVCSQIITGKITHLYETLEYTHCATLIRHMLREFSTPGSVLPTYYRALYLLLLAICEPEDEDAKVNNVCARQSFQNGFSRFIITEETRNFLSNLALISGLVQVHLVGPEESMEFIKRLPKQMGEYLKVGTLKQLGLEVFRVHGLFLADTQKKIESIPEHLNFINKLEKRDKVEEQRKLEEMVAHTRNVHDQKQIPERQVKGKQDSDDPVSLPPRKQQEINIAEENKGFSPYKSMTLASPFHRQARQARQLRSSVSGRHSYEGMPPGRFY